MHSLHHSRERVRVFAGKPITESRADIDVRPERCRAEFSPFFTCFAQMCVNVFAFYAEHAEEFLSTQQLPVQARLVSPGPHRALRHACRVVVLTAH